MSNDNEKPDRYPDVAGHRGIDASIEAAEGMTPKIGRLQKMTLAVIREEGPRGRTSDESTEACGMDRWSIQPRISELKAKRLVVDCGLRRRNSTGKNAIVWVTPEHKQEEAA
ncbi:hypothetical protein G7077_02655 [Sphingomonas piscis]|uniref:Uncharacterized protein n=1 Tax=Sphingomonas piscis TaxID=2714943 RepID=A0A6G7YMK1_9SPHN|nr:hypothetical protein [Sphingomonas piscis]QIK77975.1 hypothetical protein G7077_02655 [Sphingomonas piscis]